MIGFWFLEVNSLLFVFMLLSFFFSGQMFPPEMMPPFWPALIRRFPLQYLAYFRASVFLHKIERRGLAWARHGGPVGDVFYRRLTGVVSFGVRRYSGFGG